MLLIKKIDVLVQVLMWFVVIIFILVPESRAPFFKDSVHHFNVLYLYYIVGFWQSFSALFHFMFVQFRPVSAQRKYYQLLAAASIILLIIAFLIKYNIFGLLMLIMFTSPVLALWYTFISCNELEMWELLEDT